jgi:hypothetical protein
MTDNHPEPDLDQLEYDAYVQSNRTEYSNTPDCTRLLLHAVAYELRIIRKIMTNEYKIHKHEFDLRMKELKRQRKVEAQEWAKTHQDASRFAKTGMSDKLEEYKDPI